MFKITTRRQQQAIRDLMYGQESLPREQMTKDYQFLWDVVSDGRDEFDKYQRLLRIKEEEPDLADDIYEILAMEPGTRGKRAYRSLAEIAPELPETQWFWTNWIPKGMITSLAGYGGIGKSYIVLDINHRVIAGLPTPDGGQFNLTTGNVILVEGEHFLTQTNKRAEVWGMDRSRFYVFEPDKEAPIDFAKPGHRDLLIDTCYDLQPDLLTVDSLGTVHSKAENSVEEVRELLDFFGRLATEFNMALLLIHHLRKPKFSQTVTMHDLRGSSHLVNMSRSVLGLYTVSDDPNGPRRLKVLKTNLTKYPRPISVHLLPTSDPDIARLEYNQVDDIQTTSDNLTGQCAEWLTEQLQAAGFDGLSYQELKDAGAANDPPFSENTIQRARQLLDWQVEDTKGARVTGNCWRWHWHQFPQPDMQISCMSDTGGAKFYTPPLGHAACLHVRQQDRELERQQEREFARRLSEPAMAID